MADLTTLEARLTEAETAYHRLMTGSQEESIGLGDMQVRYTRGDAARLQAYIRELRGQVESAGGAAAGLRRRAFSVELP